MIVSVNLVYAPGDCDKSPEVFAFSFIEQAGREIDCTAA